MKINNRTLSNFFAFFLWLVPFLAPAQTVPPPFWLEIKEFVMQDSISPPPSNASLFVGSSSIKMWQNLEEYFPNLIPVQRGFGGSTLSDLIFWAPTIITPYKWERIIIYSGENDLVYDPDLNPVDLVLRFETLCKLIRETNPDTPIYYCAVKPSQLRWMFSERFKNYNELIFKYIEGKSHIYFVDIWSVLLNNKYESDTSLFLPDKLHLNSKGYSIWKSELEKSFNNQ